MKRAERKNYFLWWLLDSLTIKRSDGKIIAICLLAAALFWLLNALNKDYTTRISYPIQFDYDDSVYVAMQQVPVRIQLNASGYGWNLLKKTLRVNVTPLSYRIVNPLQTRYLTSTALLPSVAEQLRDLKINYVVNDTLFFEFDRYSYKNVVLQIDSANVNLASGYRITSPVQLKPALVSYKGPSSLIKALSDTIYLKISAKNIEESYSDDLPIDYVQSSLIHADINRTTVRFDVAPFVKQTMLMPVQLVNVPPKDSILLVDQALEVGYWVQKEESRNVQPEDFTITADFKTFNQKDSTVAVYLERKPPAVRDVTVNKNSVRVQYVE